MVYVGIRTEVDMLQERLSNVILIHSSRCEKSSNNDPVGFHG